MSSDTAYGDALASLVAAAEARCDYWEGRANQIAQRADAASEQAVRAGLSGDMPDADAEIDRCLNKAYLNGRRIQAALDGRVLVSDYDDADKLADLRRLQRLAGPQRIQVDRPDPEHTKGLRRGATGRIA